LKYISTLNYAFMMAIPDDESTPADYKKHVGKLYFSDPWADLTKETKVCSIYPEMCNYANAKNGKPNYDEKWGSVMGNFDAFLELPSRMGGLKLAVSIGGYDRWNAFEVTFGNPFASANFVTSAVTLLDTYQDKGLLGIDLDYENPDMTPEMSQDFLALVQELNQAFINQGFAPGKQFIDITVLSDPNIMNGTRQCNSGACGFAPEVLKQLSELKFVRMLNVMTYDFNGAFNYAEDGSGKTGFMTNVYPTKGSEFSIQATVDALTAQGIKAEKIAVGIPAYGRSLSGIDSDNHGLGQEITPTSKVLQGELDAQNCLEDVTRLSKTSCSGTFSYKFITEVLLQNGFEAQDVHDSQGKVNGTVAYKQGVWSAYNTLAEE
jgi:GH18 family chitinase